MTPSSTPVSGRTPSRWGGALGSVWLAALLTAVVVGLAVLTGFKAYDALDPTPQVAAESSRLTDEDERSMLLDAAAELSERVLTYHHDTFDADVRETSSRSTPEFREDYARTMRKVRANTARNRISQEATAVSSAIISATQDQAQVLVFVNQETSSARNKTERLVRNRLVVDLVRVGGDWTIAGADALG